MAWLCVAWLCVDRVSALHQFSKGRKQNRKENRRRSLFRTPTKGGERGAGDESPGQEGGASPQSGTKRDALDAELMDSYEGQQQQQDAKAGRYEAEAVSQQPQQSAAADEGPAMMATGGGGGGGSRAVDMEAEYRPLAKTERNLVDLLADADQPEPLHASIPVRGAPGHQFAAAPSAGVPVAWSPHGRMPAQAELPWSVRLNKLVVRRCHCLAFPLPSWRRQRRLPGGPSGDGGRERAEGGPDPDPAGRGGPGHNASAEHHS